MRQYGCKNSILLNCREFLHTIEYIINYLIVITFYTYNTVNTTVHHQQGYFCQYFDAELQTNDYLSREVLDNECVVQHFDGTKLEH